MNTLYLTSKSVTRIRICGLLSLLLFGVACGNGGGDGVSEDDVGTGVPAADATILDDNAVKHAINEITGTASATRWDLAKGVKCGDVLGPGGVYVLKEDLYCNVSPALTILGQTRLNLKGHTLTCGPDFVRVGIQLDGVKVFVTNGAIRECDTGVRFGGTGRHAVSNIDYAHSKPGTHSAFNVESDNNLLVDNNATACDGCFELGGDGNRLIRNRAVDGPGVAFWIFPSAENNQLFQNVARRHYAEGFLVQGNANKLLRNQAINTLWQGGAGFKVDYGSVKNELQHNISADNAGDGFSVSFAKTNRLLGNVASNNKKFGITVLGMDNLIARNKAFGNGDGVQYFDLNDGNFNCDNNKWIKNKFETRNVDCIE